MSDERWKQFDYPLNGRLITKLDSVLLPEAHFRTLQNLRYNDGGIEPVSGMTKVNTSPFSYIKSYSGFQFRKEMPNTEAHTFVQTTDPLTSASRIVKSDNTTVVPNQDTFSNFITLPTANYINFSEAPDQTMIMCDGYTNYIYSGNEYRVAQLINFDPGGSFSYDYTTIANNNLDDSDNVFTLGGVSGGIDSNTVSLLHFENNVTDSETVPKTFTANNITYSNSDYVFGSYSAIFNGTNASITVPDHADFDFTSNQFTFDLRVKVSTLATNNPLFYQSYAVTKISFTNGVVEPVVGATVNGQTSSATGVVDKVVVSSGAWGTSNAAGTLYLVSITGTWQNAENIRTVTTVNAKASSTASAAGTNYASIGIDTSGNVYFILHECYGAGSDVLSLSTASVPIAINTWYMVTVVGNGNNYFIFVGQTAGTSNLLATTTSSARPTYYTSVLSIGYDGTNYLTGKMDELRISKSARWTSTFSVPLSTYNASTSVSHLYIGSTRPISSVKFYIKTANASAATVSGYYWSGTAFAALTSVVDGTATAGATLAKTGSVSFDSTVLTCKVKAINENIAYYYHLVFSGIDTGTEISQVTCYAPPQALVDIWDGTPRQIYSFLTQKSGVFADYTVNVYAIDYSSSDALTYVNIGGMTTSDYVYVGFSERMLGIKFYYGGTNVNTNAAVMSVEYWNGAAWTTVGTIDDGTTVGGISLNRPGVVTWNSPSAKSEYIESVGNSAQWYYYRIHFSATLSANVYIDNITGIPAQVNLTPYRFPVLWQNRLWLLNDQSNNKNTARGSSYGTVCVFNGTDSPTLTFGGTQEVVAAAPLFTRYGGSIYENLVVCKRHQTYLVDGTTPDTYVVYKIAGTVGCISPRTMQVCDTGYEVAPGLTKHVVVWLSSSGVVMFDANSIINVSGDIADRFDPANPNYINASLAEHFTSFYDARRSTYHMMIATGSSTTLNEEWCYDLTRRKWYQMYRGAKYLSCGFEVEDAYGNKYTYGGTDDGYLELLENGTSFDGVGITYKFRLPDGMFDKSVMYVKEARRIKLTGIGNSTTAKITIRHYGDCSTIASTPAIAPVSQSVTGKRVFQIERSISVRGVFHSFEFEITTSDVSGGFYPLYVSGFYRVIRQDLVN